MDANSITTRLITPPSEFPVSLEDAKSFLKVTWPEEDTLIKTLIESATLVAEQFMRKVVLIDQVWNQYYDFLPDEIVLQKWPVSAVNSITYLDSTQTPTVLNSSLYVLDADKQPAKIIPAYNATWPDALLTNKSVTVNFNAGFADAASVPENMISAVKLIIQNLWENRPLTDGPLVPKAAQILLFNERVY